MPPVKLIVFDIAGTIIEDHGEVIHAFTKALTDNGIPFAKDELKMWVGASKREVIRHFITQADPRGQIEQKVEASYLSFREELQRAASISKPGAPAFEITLVGHSMGTMVLNEWLRRDILDQKHGEIGRIDRTDRDQRPHVHQQAAVAFDHDHRPAGLRSRQTERQRQRQAHGVFEVKILRRLVQPGPEIGGVA